jgi:cardiolipin synthase
MEVLFHDADPFFKSLISALERAQKNVHYESYIFEKDTLGKLIIRHLLRAAKRGVKVSLVIDGIGSSSFKAKDIIWFRNRGIDLHIYNPLPSQVIYVRPVQFSFSLFKSLWFINKRNHRKMCLIDKKHFFAGSFNTSMIHSRYFSGRNAWRDSGVRLTFSHKNGLSRSRVRLNHTKRLRLYYYRELLRRIDQAQGRIWITNPYFVPPLKLSNALIKARQRGVDVRLIIPERCDLLAFPLINALYYKRLVKCGVRVHAFRPRVLHAKTMLIDDWAILGSTNLNSRSRLHDLEVDVALKSQHAINSLEYQFITDLSHTKTIGHHDIIRRYGRALPTFPFWKLVSYWL